MKGQVGFNDYEEKVCITVEIRKAAGPVKGHMKTPTG
jgi:hypothetical protein